MPRPTQTTESFRQHLPNTAGDRPQWFEQFEIASLWSSPFNPRAVRDETSERGGVSPMALTLGCS